MQALCMQVLGIGMGMAIYMCRVMGMGRVMPVGRVMAMGTVMPRRRCCLVCSRCLQHRQCSESGYRRQGQPLIPVSLTLQYPGRALRGDRVILYPPLTTESHLAGRALRGVCIVRASCIMPRALQARNAGLGRRRRRCGGETELGCP